MAADWLSAQGLRALFATGGAQSVAVMVMLGMVKMVVQVLFWLAVLTSVYKVMILPRQPEGA
ncbi:hypothetical protein [Paracoccus zhouxuedongae]|uniref:hypothetical protein n=1 Tax=unclassified Paracoccus (in: a-proteobacteria) TaxID=2688777 RepID=UPI0035B8FD10